MPSSAHLAVAQLLWAEEGRNGPATKRLQTSESASSFRDPPLVMMTLLLATPHCETHMHKCTMLEQKAREAEELPMFVQALSKLLD